MELQPQKLGDGPLSNRVPERNAKQNQIKGQGKELGMTFSRRHRMVRNILEMFKIKVLRKGESQSF